MSKVHNYVTERVIESLKNGIVPWQKPWSVKFAKPMSIDGRPYRGVNTFLAALTGFDVPVFLTAKRAKKLGATVTDPNPTMVVFWNRIKVDDKDNPGEKKTVPLLRYYNVYNIEQCEGLPEKILEKFQEDERPFTEIEVCEHVLTQAAERGIPAPSHGGDKACYSPTGDTIQVPKRGSFKSDAEYYSTLFHEMVHSTGHHSRLDRKLTGNFGDDSYSMEELVAEMGCTMLMAHCGIERTFDNSVAYIGNWLSKLGSDPKMVVNAAQRAQKAVDLILGYEYKTEDD